MNGSPQSNHENRFVIFPRISFSLQARRGKDFLTYQSLKPSQGRHLGVGSFIISAVSRKIFFFEWIHTEILKASLHQIPVIHWSVVNTRENTICWVTRIARWRSASLIDPAALVIESVPVASARKLTA